MTNSDLPFKQIGDVVLDVDTWNPARTASGQLIQYIDLGSVDNETKTVSSNSKISADEAPSRARQIVKLSDVLVSTVRPNLNGVAQVSQLLDGATASTGFCVLRADNHRLAPAYLFHWVKSPIFIADMERQATGQSYPAVSDRIIKSSKIPLPPLDEQRRIAAILDQADALRRKRREAIALLGQLRRSAFTDMFGDPAFNPKGWPVGRISDVTASTQYGTSSKAGERGKFPILRMGNLTSEGGWKLDDLKFIDFQDKEIEKYTVKKGDILFNRTNSPDLVGKTAVFREDQKYGFAGYLVRLRLNTLAEPDYVSCYLNSTHGKATLRGMCKSIIGMANINAKELISIPLMLPPIATQMAFADVVQQTLTTERSHLAHLSQLDALFASLQHRAFRGEL